MTFTPDSKLLYIATENTDSVVAIDVAARKEVDADQGRQRAEAQHHGGHAVVRWPVVVAAGVLAGAVLTGLGRSGAAAADDELPDGEGKKILSASCTTCHDLKEVLKLRGYYTRAQWRDVIVTMKEYGAEVDETQIEVLADYLGQHLGKK